MYCHPGGIDIVGSGMCVCVCGFSRFAGAQVREGCFFEFCDNLCGIVWVIDSKGTSPINSIDEPFKILRILISSQSQVTVFS